MAEDQKGRPELKKTILTEDGELTPQAIQSLNIAQAAAKSNRKTEEDYRLAKEAEMLGYIVKLVEVNKKMDGVVFNEFRKGKNKMLIAGSPIVTVDDDIITAGYLIISKSGFSVLEVLYKQGDTPLNIGQVEAGQEIVNTIPLENSRERMDVTLILKTDPIKSGFKFELMYNNVGRPHLHLRNTNIMAINYNGEDRALSHFYDFFSKEETFDNDPNVENHVAYIEDIGKNEANQMVNTVITRRLVQLEKKRDTTEKSLEKLRLEAKEPPIELNIPDELKNEDSVEKQNKFSFLGLFTKKKRK